MRRDGDPVPGTADVDARGVRVGDGQRPAGGAFALAGGHGGGQNGGWARERGA
jgi:hypothetical protein